jgi:hypothetical protein
MIKHQRLLRASPTRQTHDRRPLGGAHGSRALKGERNGNCRHAAIDGLAAWVMMGPEEMALLRLARAAAAQRRLAASAAQQERDARAAAAQRRLVAAQQPSRMTGFGAASSANTKMHSRRRSHHVSPRSSLNSKHRT